MKKTKKNNLTAKTEFLKYTVENFVHLILENEILKQDLVELVNSLEVEEELIKKALLRIEFAYKRIKMPLDNSTRFLLLIFPFGFINRFNNESFFDLEENKKLGFVRKTKEYIMYSFSGLFIYAVVISLLIIFNQVN